MKTIMTKRHPGFAAFRYYILPALTPQVIDGLREALDQLDPRLTQGVVCRPSGFNGYEQEAQQACLLGFCGMLVGCTTVGEVNKYFHMILEDIEKTPGGGDAFNQFLCLWDGYTREYVAQYLVQEIDEFLEESLPIRSVADTMLASM